MAEPTSVLTFSDLILEVAREMGVGYFGADGTGVLQIPSDAHDLAECKRHVNNAIRMFIHDAPPWGWRWVRPVASVIVWGSVAVSASVTISGGTYDSVNNQTTLTATAASFYPTMERKTLTLTTTGDVTIESYTSSTVVIVTGDQSSVSAETFSVTADGDYTLPQTFGGQHLGRIHYGPASQVGVSLDWTDEGTIRAWRADTASDAGQPWMAAVRPMTVGSPRRRWELMLYSVPSQVYTMTLPYELYFEQLTALTEVQPAPYIHDETVKAACLAKVEQDVDKIPNGPLFQEYQRCLQGSYNADRRTAPSRIGLRRGNTIATDRFRSDFYQRPNVTFNP